MGCGTSKQASSAPTPARRSARTDQPIQLQRVGASTGGSHRYPERTEMAMTSQIRAEFLNATDRAFGTMEYGVIGGGALAEYGNRRVTSDVDVIVPHAISEVVEAHLLSHGMVRTARGGLGYIASDGRCYGLDITADRAVGQTFNSDRDTQRTERTSARLTTLGFLLNSKAYAYMTRAGPDSLQKQANDAADFLFIVEYMRRYRVGVNRKACRWVVDYDFWTSFCNKYEGAERALTALGLHKDPTPSSSNRETRNSSRTRSSGNRSRSSQRS